MRSSLCINSIHSLIGTDGPFKPHEHLNQPSMATDLAKGEENVGVPIHGPRVKGEPMKAAAWYGSRDIRGTWIYTMLSNRMRLLFTARSHTQNNQSDPPTHPHK
jgi:hypothetical protein